MNEEVQFRRPELMPLSILRAVWKRKLTIAGVFVLLASLSIIVILLLPPVYSARSLILIEQQRIPERFVASTVNEGLDSRLNRIAQKILAYENLARIIAEFDLYQSERGQLSEEEIILKMREHINVSLVTGLTTDRGNTTAFQISFEDSHPESVAQVANRLAANFIDENQLTRTTSAQGTSQFINDEIAEAERQLKEVEDRRSDFKSLHMGELPEQESAISIEISRRQLEYQAAEAEVARAHQSKLFLDNNLEAAVAALDIVKRAAEEEKASSSSGSSGPAPSQLRSQVSAASANYEAVKARYSENHPDVVQAKAYLEELRASLAATEAESEQVRVAAPVTTGGISSETQGMILQAETRVKQIQTQLDVTEQTIKTAEARRRDAAAAVASASARMGRMPLLQQELAGVERDYETALRHYQELSRKSFDANLATTMEQRERSERFTPLENARVPSSPIWPPRELFAGGSTLASLVLACLLGIALEIKKNVVLGEWEMPADIPVLGRIPIITPELEGDGMGAVTGRSRSGAFKRAAVASSVLLSLVAMGVATSLYFGWISF